MSTRVSSRSIVFVGLTAMTVAWPSIGAAALVQPMGWSLQRPTRDLAALAGASDRVADAPFVPAEATAGRPPERTGVRVAPTVSNLLDSRRVASLEAIGVPGSGDNYVRATRRTIGIALTKPLF